MLVHNLWPLVTVFTILALIEYSIGQSIGRDIPSLALGLTIVVGAVGIIYHVVLPPFVKRKSNTTSSMHVDRLTAASSRIITLLVCLAGCLVAYVE